QAEDGIRDRNVTGVQTCALPICLGGKQRGLGLVRLRQRRSGHLTEGLDIECPARADVLHPAAYLRRAGARVRATQVHITFLHRRSEERRVGKECRYRWDSVSAYR